MGLYVKTLHVVFFFLVCALLFDVVQCQQFGQQTDAFPTRSEIKNSGIQNVYITPQDQSRTGNDFVRSYKTGSLYFQTPSTAEVATVKEVSQQVLLTPSNRRQNDENYNTRAEEFTKTLPPETNTPTGGEHPEKLTLGDMKETSGVADATVGNIVQDTSPCSSQFISGENIVDCTGLFLTEIHSQWFPMNTTRIILDKNALTRIPSSALSHLHHLRNLSIVNNRIQSIDIDAFRGLENLESLNLMENPIAINNFKYITGVFDSLLHLKELSLQYDTDDNAKNYPATILSKMKDWDLLNTDITDDRLYLGPEFVSLQNLSKLTISGNVRTIDERTFKNVNHLTDLVLDTFINLSNLSEDALQHLLNLDKLKLGYVRIDIAAALKILKPMIGKNMTEICFDSVVVSIHDSYESFSTEDGILDASKTKYLREICVRKFSLINSAVYVIEGSALYSKVWNDCLRILDLSGNPLVGAKITLFQILNLKHIEHFYLSNRRHQEFSVSGSQEYLPGGTETVSLRQESGQVMTSNDPNSKLSNSGDRNKNDSFQVQSRFYSINARATACSPSHLLHEEKSIYMSVKLSNSLQSLHLRNSVGHNGLTTYIQVHGANNLVYLDVSEGMLYKFQGQITGLELLRTLIVSGNKMSILSETFFDTFCSLENLYLSSCLLNVDFMSNNSARMFQNLPWLQRLDLSTNFLYALSQNTFARNGQLEVLNLSKNRFSKIPFNLHFTPNLRVLDLRDNSLTSLGITERESLDNLAEQPEGFQLKLSGNILSCACSNLPFLQWLRTTHVQLDVVNIRCLNDLGQLVNVGEYTDLMDFWRKCWGSFFLSLAVSVFFIMIIAFLVVFFLWKHRIFIKSFMLQLVTGHKLKEPSDYRTGVYIGYADRDYAFPCFVLRKFIEDEVKLNTYLSHRDLDPASDIASSIVHAMNGSWRIILVFSNNFLYSDEWSVFTFRSAMYAQTAENPGRVVVLVDENLQHRLPSEVVSAVSEDNIIVISRWRMTYEVREKLKCRLAQI